jgi:hypothetical protein
MSEHLFLVPLYRTGNKFHTSRANSLLLGNDAGGQQNSVLVMTLVYKQFLKVGVNGMFTVKKRAKFLVLYKKNNFIAKHRPMLAVPPRHVVFTEVHIAGMLHYGVR